jgi:hypothetical protein
MRFSYYVYLTTVVSSSSPSISEELSTCIEDANRQVLHDLIVVGVDSAETSMPEYFEICKQRSKKDGQPGELSLQYEKELQDAQNAYKFTAENHESLDRLGDQAERIVDIVYRRLILTPDEARALSDRPENAFENDFSQFDDLKPIIPRQEAIVVVDAAKRYLKSLEESAIPAERWPLVVKYVEVKTMFMFRELDSIAQKIINGEPLKAKFRMIDLQTDRRERFLRGESDNAAFYVIDAQELLEVDAALRTFEDLIKRDTSIRDLMSQMDSKILQSIHEGFGKNSVLTQLQKLDETNRELLKNGQSPADVVASYNLAFSALKADLGIETSTRQDGDPNYGGHLSTPPSNS